MTEPTVRGRPRRGEPGERRRLVRRRPAGRRRLTVVMALLLSSAALPALSGAATTPTTTTITTTSSTASTTTTKTPTSPAATTLTATGPTTPIGSAWTHLGTGATTAAPSTTSPAVVRGAHVKRRTAAQQPTATGASVFLAPGVVSPIIVSAQFQAYVTPKNGSQITQVEFQYSPAGADSWQMFDTQTAPVSGIEYDGNLNVGSLQNVGQLPNGAYDFRAVALSGATEEGTSAIQTYVVATNVSFVSLSSTGSPLHGQVPLTATWDNNASSAPTVTFESCPVSASCAANFQAAPDPQTGAQTGWTPIATVSPTTDINGNTQPYVATFDTTTLADGTYYLAITAQDGVAGDAFEGGFIGPVLVDHTPPTATLASPGGSLSGMQTLTASAQDSGTGIEAVKFESSPAGANTWTTIGVATSPPYSVSFDTSQLADGSYDLRAEATDGAGNTAASPVVSNVAISNPSTQNFDSLTLTNFVAPATNVRLLGEIRGNPQHETWAMGQTSAPPPIVSGAPLPYTAQGGAQEVVLKYTDDTGWRIVDVLRNPDGSPYPLSKRGNPVVNGQMTATGEAWIVFSDDGSNFVLFHRLPGGQFLLDPAATATLRPSLSNTSRLVLGQTSTGTTYGLVLQSPAPLLDQQTLQTPAGARAVLTGLDYGSLINGTWTLQRQPLPADYAAPAGDRSVDLVAADPTGPGTGWAVLDQSAPNTFGGPFSDSAILARFDPSGWHFVAPIGLDALDFTAGFAPTSAASAGLTSPVSVQPTGIRADSSEVWISASDGSNGRLIARYDISTGRVTNSWCTSLVPQSLDCAQSLDLDHPAAIPDATFDTPQGAVADALDPSPGSHFIDIYSHGHWTSVPAPGFGGGGGASGPGFSTFADPGDGWLVGASSLARLSVGPLPAPLATWPEANRNPLLSVALPPGQSTTDTPGALAVGLNGTALHYDATAGWQVDGTPRDTHHLALDAVAFDGPTSAFAVGQGGTILRWDGSHWSEDPQSRTLTPATLDAVAFAGDGQGWAVGGFGTILHYDGSTWSQDTLDPSLAGAEVTSVAVAGGDAFAVAGATLVERSPVGTWRAVPTPAALAGKLNLVAGLPDGGLVVAGANTLYTRQSATAQLQPAPESFQGIPVALALFRDASGQLKTFVSVAPPVANSSGVGGFPAGDGDLLRETGGGFEDLGRAQSPLRASTVTGDGVVQPDPVLAVASSPDGTHAWAVGGYSGTLAADGIGAGQSLAARPPGWFASSIWRYDAGGSAQSPALTSPPVSLPANPGAVSFAFFTTPQCLSSCAAVQDAQPDVNLRAAAGEIAAFAQQPGGPAFAILGGDARGPVDPVANARGAGALELGRLPPLLASLGQVPTYAAYGPLDAVPTASDRALPWATTFAKAPAPFGSGPVPSGITPQSSGDPTGPVHRYYDFDVTQNGGTLRVIVLDNSAGSLEGSAPGQTAWLDAQLAAAQAAGLPVVAITALPLTQASDGDAVAAQLVGAGALAVFTMSTYNQGDPAESNQVEQVPVDASPGQPQIPDYEGATLGYQQSQNNGVVWYDVSVDTVRGTVSVKGIPVISSLALDPVDGLTAARSSTLSFQAIGRRPPGTIAPITTNSSSFIGYDQYVEIPAKNCSGCIGPTYSFASSDPVVGDFVVPTSPGSPYPKLTGDGKTIHSSTSGLFCAFNTGTTTVSVTSGLLTSSLPVTVESGGFGPPCGTVPGGTSRNIITVPGRVITQKAANPGAGAPVPPPATGPLNTLTPKLALPPPPAPVFPVRAPAPVPKPAPAPKPVAVTSVPTFVPQPAPTLATPPIVPPLIPPALTPVPPGGATVSAQAAARREEKARKHARQSAYTTRPAGTSATDWFYPVLGAVTLLALLLAAEGLRPGPRRKPALAEVRDPMRPWRH